MNTQNKIKQPQLMSRQFQQAAQPIGELHQLLTCPQAAFQLQVPVDCSAEENLAARLAADFWQLYTVNRWWQEEMMLSVTGLEPSQSGSYKTQRADKPLQASSCPVQCVELLGLFLRNVPQGLVDKSDLIRFRTYFAPLLMALEANLRELASKAASALEQIDHLIQLPIENDSTKITQN